jgi:3-hydroxyacyl-[acyl-carrier-protein] dehydratase
LTRDEIIGIKTFSDTDQFLRGSFPDFYYVPGVILIEAMAQCGGAGIKKLGIADGLFGFAQIDNAMFYHGVEYEVVFKMIIKNLRISDKYMKQSGEGFVNDQLCLSLTWTCIKFSP